MPLSHTQTQLNGLTLARGPGVRGGQEVMCKHMLSTTARTARP